MHAVVSNVIHISRKLVGTEERNELQILISKASLDSELNASLASYKIYGTVSSSPVQYTVLLT